MPEKKCSKCHMTKDLKQFSNEKASKDGKQSYCQHCKTLSNSENGTNTHDGIVAGMTRRQYMRLRSYGITPQQTEDMLASQGYCCAICFTPLNDNFHVDHCHASTTVRGLLCRSCNLMLGQAKDDTNILTNAIAYLKGNPNVNQ